MTAGVIIQGFLTHNNTELQEKAEEVMDSLFVDLNNDDDWLFLEERLENDPEMA